MNNQELIQARLAFLEDTVQFYSHDPKGRRSLSTSGCMYRNFNGCKCAIGRHIPDDKYSNLMEGKGVQVFFESINTGSKATFPDVLPKEIAELGEDFLREVQSLHDEDYKWTDTGLSKGGEEAVAYIKRRYCQEDSEY